MIHCTVKKRLLSKISQSSRSVRKVIVASNAKGEWLTLNTEKDINLGFQAFTHK